MKKANPLDRPRSLNEFLATAKTYIMYEGQLYNDNVNKSRKEDPIAESSEKSFQEKKEEGKLAHDNNGPIGCFSEYTP